MSTTYDALVSNVQAEAEWTGDSEFTDSIPLFIGNAENRLSKEIDDYGIVATSTITLTASTYLITQPTRMLLPKHVIYNDGSGTRTILQLRTDEWCFDYWNPIASVGTPKYYAHFDSTQLMIVPTPASANTVEVLYVERPTTLSASNQSNYFATHLDDALLYATMAEASLFMKNPAMLQMWEAQYQRAIDSIRNAARRNRKDDNREPASPAGADNNLIDGNR